MMISLRITGETRMSQRLNAFRVAAARVELHNDRQSGFILNHVLIRPHSRHNSSVS